MTYSLILDNIEITSNDMTGRLITKFRTLAVSFSGTLYIKIRHDLVVIENETKG